MRCMVSVLLCVNIMSSLTSVERLPIDDIVAYTWDRATKMSFAGRHEESIEYINIALKLAPDNASLYIKRSGEYVKLDMNAEAIDDLEFSLTLNPIAVDAYVGLTRAYNRVGDRENSEIYLKKVVNFNSKTDYDHMLKNTGLFVIYIEINQMKKAIELSRILYKFKNIHGNYKIWLESDRVFDNIRDERWYKELIESVN